MPSVGDWALDGPRWRSIARLGALRGPEWLLRIAPPVIGLAVWAFSGERRRAVRANLGMLRASRGPFGDAVDVARTFTGYASSVTDVLRGARRSGKQPEGMIRGDAHLDDACAEGKGVVLVTAHTAGWEFAGRLLLRDRGVKVMIVEQAERDPVARAIQDEARREQGLLVAHAGDDPFSALPLLRHLRGGGILALQIDRVPPGMRSRRVRLFEREGRIPEGPLRLAAASGAPILPVFAARARHGHYEIVVQPALRLSRGASEADLDLAAQHLADSFVDFVRRRPTQWFTFHPLSP
jgi:KDO2-lipid IV(A) lauroyltransferase